MKPFGMEPLDPLEAAYRAIVARRHRDARREGRTWVCGCGMSLPCPTVNALLSDIAQDLNRLILK